MVKPNSVVEREREREREENAVQQPVSSLTLSGCDLALEQYYEHRREKTVIQKK